MTFAKQARLVVKTHRACISIFDMDGGMVDGKSVFPRPFRALPEVILRDGFCALGLVRESFRPDAVGCFEDGELDTAWRSRRRFVSPLRGGKIEHIILRLLT